MKWMTFPLPPAVATFALATLTAWGSDPLPPCWRADTNTTLQAWRFNTNTLPASPEVVTSPGAPTASVLLGVGAGGWINTLYVFGTNNQGIWDLGPAGTMTLSVPNHIAPSSSWKYVSVQVTEYRDVFYKSNVDVTLPGATLVSTQSVNVASAPFGGGKWVVNQSLWLMAPCPTNETITLTATVSGAAIDEVVVDTLCSTGDDGDLFAPCWRNQTNTTWQDWSFHTSPNPSTPERGNHPGASATAVVGAGGTGWRDRLSAVGCRQGFWDLGNNGSLTLTIPNTAGTATSYKYVRVQAVMYQDSLVYTIPAAVTVPGATQIGGEETSVVDTGTLGQWMVRQTVWKLAPCPTSEQVVITAPAVTGKGALVDQVIVDTLALDWPVPPNQTVNTASGLCESGAVTWTLPTPDSCKLLGASSTPASGSTLPKGTNSVTVTYTDAEHQAYVTNLTVVVLDNEAPVATCPSDMVATNDGVNCGAVVTFTATATDNCPGAIVTCVPASGSVFPLGTTTVTCTAMDASGNVSAPCSFTVTVLDTTGDVAAPCWRGEPNTTFQHWTFGTSASPVGPDSVSNAGSPLATVTTGPGSTGWKSTNAPVYGCRQGFWDLGRYGTISLAIPNVGGAPQSYKYVRVQVVQYRDSSIFTSNAVVSIAGATQVGAAHQVILATTTLGYWISEETLWKIAPCPNSETVLLTGGYYGALIDQVVVDTLCTEPPACPPSLNLVADPGFCSQSNVTWTTPAADGCLIQSISYSPTNGSTFIVGGTTVTQSVTDAESQIQTCTFTVTVTDTQPPDAVPQNITVPLDNLGNASISPSEMNGGSTDNCGIAGLSISQTNFTCANLGPNDVTLTVTDVNGLTVTCVAVVTIVDQTPPVAPTLADVTGECSATLTAPTATDNCAGTVTGTTATVFPITAQGTNVVTWAFDDGNGNVSTQTQLVIVMVEANLGLTMSAVPNPIYVGGSLVYTMTVSNAGPCTATGVQLNLLPPIGIVPLMITNGTNPGMACPRPGPVAWWRAENNANDSAGSNHGTTSGGVAYSNGIIGKAFSFDGTNDSVSVPDSTSLRPTNLTIEGWMKIQDVTGVHAVIGKRVGSATLDSYSVWIESGVLYASIANSNSSGAFLRYPEFPSYSYFQSDDLVNLQSFAFKLKIPTDQVSQFIKTNLSAPTLILLAGYSGGTNDALHAALIADLNVIIGGGSIYTPVRFAGVTLSPESQYILGRNPTGEDLLRLNRYLIRDAYPAEFAPDVFPQLNQWFHVAYSFDAATDVQALYINGELVDVGFETNGIGYDSHPVYLGADDDNGSPGYFYQGLIDELTLYGRALTGSEIQAVYRAGAGGKSATPSQILLAAMPAFSTQQVSLVALAANCGGVYEGAVVQAVTGDPTSANNSVTVYTTVQDLPSSLWVMGIEEVSPNSEDLRLTWPIICGPTGLEAASSLNSPITWSPLTVPVQIIDNRQNTLVPATNAFRYFRMKSP